MPFAVLWRTVARRYNAPASQYHEQVLDDLRALADKYEQLLALCAAPGERTPARRDAMRLVAERFPGALREWESLSPAALRQRRALIQQAIVDGGAIAILWGDGGSGGSGAGRPAWLRLSLLWHGHLRGLLALRRALRGTPEGDGGGLLVQGLQIYEDAGGRLGCLIDPARVDLLRAAAPLRVSALAYADLGAQAGLSAAAVQAALFTSEDEPHP